MIKNKIQSLLFILFASALIISCKKDQQDLPTGSTGSVTDVNGNVYKTVKIGSQWWMAEDLKVKTYRNGNPVSKVDLQSGSQSDSMDWVTDQHGSYCDNFDNANKPIGKFYNWYAVSNPDKIAPQGWHVPTDNEWKELEKYLGMSQAQADQENWRGSHEGEKLKIASPNGWTQFESIWSTNESGFTALAGGCRLFDGRSGTPGLYSTGFWWTASAAQNSKAWYRYLDYKNANVFRSNCSENYGFSIRCVKD